MADPAVRGLRAILRVVLIAALSVLLFVLDLEEAVLGWLGRATGLAPHRWRLQGHVLDPRGEFRGAWRCRRCGAETVAEGRPMNERPGRRAFPASCDDYKTVSEVMER